MHFRISILLLWCCFFSSSLGAQVKLPPDGGNPRASVSQEIGITEITVRYSRPKLKGRQGKIWGDLVPFGFRSYNVTANKNISPWRAGANENTTITFQHPVNVERQPLQAGTYGLFIAIEADSSIIIFSRQSSAWGSEFYDAGEDALRVKVKTNTSSQPVELLAYEFTDHTENTATISLKWEQLEVHFNVWVNVDSLVIASLRNELKGHKGEYSTSYVDAAQYCVRKNIHLDEALKWSRQAIKSRFGQTSYATLRNLASVYEKMNKLTQADSVMAHALTIAAPAQFTSYARLLINQKRSAKAVEIMKQNAEKHGEVFQVFSGLMYAYSAVGDFKTSMKYANLALSKASSEFARQTILNNLEKLKNGVDIN